MPRRLVPVLLAVMLVVAACAGSAGTSGDTTPTTGGGVTTTTAVPPTTTTTAPLPEFGGAEDALAYLYSFDPVDGNPDAIRLALDAIPGGHFPGSPIPALLAAAGPQVAEVILDDLSVPSAQNVHILVAMERFGTPAGSLAEPVPWRSPVRIGISAALQSASVGYFGRFAPIATDFTRRLLHSEVAGCAPTCPWPGSWYDVPTWVAEVRGTVGGDLFEGRVRLTGADGATRSEEVTMELIIGRWVVTAGYLAEADAPVFAITAPLDGVYVTDAVVALSGVAEPGTTVSVGTDSFTVDDFQFWDLIVTLSPGRNELAVSATNAAGKETTETLTLFYVPQAQPAFGFVVAADAASVTVDPAQLLFGEEADAAARADGVIGEDEVVADGYYVANPDPTTVVYPVDPGVRVIVVDTGVVFTLVSYADLQGFLAGRTGAGSAWYAGNPILSPFNLLLVDGTVVQIEEQFLP
jgi:hypothetical protein